MDLWIANAGSTFFNSDSNTSSTIKHFPAYVFSALFFRLPDHPQLAIWAERARNSLEALPYPTRLTLARRLLRYDIFFGRPARATLLMDSLRAQHVARQQALAVRVQWGLLQALHQDALGNHSECLETVQQTQASASRDSTNQWATMLHALEISAYIGLSDMDAAHQAWQKSLTEQPQRGLLGMTYLHQLGAQIALADGNNAQALEHAEAALRVAMRAGAPLYRALSCLAVVEVHLERGDPDTAEPKLCQAEQIAQATGSAQLACLCAFMRAYRMVLSNANAPAENELRLGFSLAARHDYQNFFWWSPRMMTTLCVNALERGIETNYIQKLVQSRQLMPAITPVHVESWPWPVKIYTLGRFTVLINNQPARNGRKAQRKPLELLKALIALGGREVSEESLTSMLWPDAEGDTARQAFDTTLHRLRKLLESEQAILMHDRKLSLNNRLCWVDSWAFERLLSETETLLAYPAADQGGTALDEHVNRVFALYHGPFLGKEFGAAWSVSLRERLRSRYLRHLLSIGVRWQQLGHWDRAIECYRKGLEVDDLAEQLYQNLMLCHHQLGQHGEALAVYKRCRFILSAVLGIAPGSKIESLYQQLRVSK